MYATPRLKTAKIINGRDKMTGELGFEVHLNLAYDEALERVIAALKGRGFGVLTRIDVKDTLKEKLGEEFRPYIILGACNPPLAHRALTNDPVIGLLLPCNVTVESDESGGSLVRIGNPEMMMNVGNIKENAAVASVAKEARALLEAVATDLLVD
jgi:uncharacterized protein (DUF302 family)